MDVATPSQHTAISIAAIGASATGLVTPYPRNEEHGDVYGHLLWHDQRAGGPENDLFLAYLFAGPKEMSIMGNEDTIQETPIHGESDAAC